MIHVYQINGHDILWCHVNMVSKLKQQLKASAANPVASGLGWESPGPRWNMFSDFHPDIPTIFSHKMHQNDSKCKHIHQITAFPWHVLPHFSESGDLQSAPPVFEWAMMRLFQRDLVGWVSNRLHASGTQLQRFDSGLSPLHHLWWLHSSMGWPECEDDSQLEHP